MRCFTWVAAATTAAAFTGISAAQPAPEAPASGDEPPPHYYTEPPEPPAEPQGPGPEQPAPPAPAPAQGGYYEPPPPGMAHPAVYEPPPPPKPKHVAPKTALWLGARLAYFVPFGSAWSEYLVDDYGYFLNRIPWSNYASTGGAVELDVGMRLGRRYNLFLTWEHAELGGRGGEPERVPVDAPELGGPAQARTDFYALGIRFSSDPDQVGFLTEFMLGYRTFTASWDDGTELVLDEAPFEFRIGLGADIRLSPAFSLSPMVTLGVGVFGEGEWRLPSGETEDAIRGTDERDSHGWLTLQLGGHFDIGGTD